MDYKFDESVEPHNVDVMSRIGKELDLSHEDMAKVSKIVSDVVDEQSKAEQGKLGENHLDRVKAVHAYIESKPESERDMYKAIAKQAHGVMLIENLMAADKDKSKEKEVEVEVTGIPEPKVKEPELFDLDEAMSATDANGKLKIEDPAYLKKILDQDNKINGGK